MPENPLSPSAVLNAHPVLRVDSQPSERLDTLLLALRLTESEGGMSSLEMRLSNFASNPQGGADFAFEDEALLKLGAQLAVYTGDVNAPREIFQGVITGIEAEFPGDNPPEIVVLAEDVFQRARMARRTQLRENITLDTLVRDLAQQLGLTPRVSGLAQNIGNQMQLNESDLAFVRRILNRYDADLQVVGTELHAAPRAQVERGEIELALHSQLRRVRVLSDLAHQVTKITVSGWDPAQGQRVSATAQGANLGPGQGRTGAQLLQQTLGARPHHIGHLAALTSGEAQALADAAFDARARRFVCVQATAEGNPALRVGTHVKLTGIGSRFSNTYYITRAVHRYDSRSGYLTDFDGECAYWGQA